MLEQAQCGDGVGGIREVSIAIPGDEALWGVLTIGADPDGDPTALDPDLLIELAVAIGVIVEAAQRSDEVAHRLHRADALRRVASDIGSRLDLDRILASRAFTRTVGFADRERIDRICRYVAEHSTRPIVLAEAAAAAHMSVPAFTRFFRKCTGKTFLEYLTELRVGAACRLLMETDRTVAQVCSASGFGNLSNFNRRFRDLKGITPREFRRQYSP